MNATYQQEVIQRQQEIIRALQNELDWEKRLFSNPTLKPPDKLILWKTTPPEVKRGQAIEQPEEKKLYITRDAGEIGMSPDTYGSRLQRIAETTQALAHRREREPAQDGTPVWRVYVAPTPALAAPEKIELPPAGAGHGGRRVKKCLSCGSSNLVETRQVVCADCGVPQSDKTIHLVNPPDEDAIPQDDDSATSEQNASPQDDGRPQEELEDPKIFCEPAGNLTEYYDPVTPPIVSEVFPAAVEVEQSEIISDWPARKMTYGDFSLEEWLARRIGEGQTIWSTGDVEQVNLEKYYSHKVGTKLDIKGYLEGKPRCIYGSPLRLKDGKTWVLSFDIDKTEQALLKFDYLRMLARAGIYAVYWQRRPGKAHLEIYFSEEVDINAAYAWVISVCPALASVEECYPYNGKFNGRVSWPLYHRLKTFDENKQEISDQVIECAAIAMLPGENKPIHCAGMKSDPEGLRAIVAQAVTPAALIPELPVTQASDEATKPGGELLDTRSPKYSSSSSDGLGKAVIAEFNDVHTWEEIAALCGGLHRDRFCSPAHKEDTPSVVIRGNYASDYGRTPSGRVETRDKFGWWCQARGINQDEELKRLIAERQVLA